MSEERDARRAKKLTQKQVAEMAGVAVGTVQNIEAGKTESHPGNLLAVRRVLGLAGDAEETRRSWSPDVLVFLDVMGAFLTALPEDERYAKMRQITSGIMARQHPNG